MRGSAALRHDPDSSNVPVSGAGGVNDVFQSQALQSEGLHAQSIDQTRP
jgi:hypothetical protein